MNPCSNCGKLNTPETNFCRFCGTKFTMAAPQKAENPYEYPAPRPYAWKTDEFQTQNEARRTQSTHSLYTGTSPMPEAGSMLAQSQFGGSAVDLNQPYRCPNCLSTYYPRVERRISTAGWITFAVLLVFFFPLFWIGLLIKEEVRVCQSCNTKVG